MKRTYGLVKMDTDSIKDRMNWSKDQWYEDAVRIMAHIDGASGSLLNGHVNALIWKAREATARAEAAELAIARVRELASPDWCLSVPGGVKQAILDRIGGTA